MAKLHTSVGCTRHPDRPALAACDRCRKPICRECAIPVSADRVFCSEACAAGADPEYLGQIQQGLDQPFILGFRLWYRSLPSLLRYTLPLVVLYFFVSALFLALYHPGKENVTPAAVIGLIFFVVFVYSFFGYGIALMDVVLTRCATGWLPGNLYLVTLRRAVPLVGAWFMLNVVAFLATVPGIVVYALTSSMAASIGVSVIGGLAVLIPLLRFAWTQEFIISNSMGPLQALQSSWILMKDRSKEQVLFELRLLFAALLIAPFAVAAGFGIWKVWMLRRDWLSWPLNFAIPAVLIAGAALFRTIRIVRFQGLLAAQASGVGKGSGLHVAEGTVSTE